MSDEAGNDDKIRELEQRIAELERQWPAHSVPPAMLQLLDDLEEELEREKAAREESGRH
jgi:hypothetical protein